MNNINMTNFKILSDEYHCRFLIQKDMTIFLALNICIYSSVEYRKPSMTKV